MELKLNIEQNIPEMPQPHGKLVAVVSDLNRESYELLNTLERYKNQYVYYYSWCVGGRLDEVTYSWCIQRSYNYRGEHTPGEHYELCVRQAESAQSDPWLRIIFFAWNEKHRGPCGDDGRRTEKGRPFVDTLYVFEKL